MNEDRNKKKKKKGKSKKDDDFPDENDDFPDENDDFSDKDDDDIHDGEEQKELMKKMFEMFGKSFSGKIHNKDFFNLDLNKIIRDLLKQMKFDPRQFQNMKNIDNKELQKIFRENAGKIKMKGPMVFGFNMKIGKDGMPVIDSFGNVKPKQYGATEIKNVREPLIDVIDDDEDELIVVAEIPGVLKENIEIKANERSITIIGYNEEKEPKYDTTIDLPCRINPDHAQASLKNGILEVKLQKDKEDQKSKKISVE
ncbi:MAG: archaeal heat shock protein Hsp20 [Promethearchaeota archaeon]